MRTLDFIFSPRWPWSRRLVVMSMAFALGAFGCGGGGQGVGGTGGGGGPPPPTGSTNAFVLGAFPSSPSPLTAATTLGVATVRPTPNFSWNGEEPVLGGGYVWELDAMNNTPDTTVRAAQAVGLDLVAVLLPSRREYLPACAAGDPGVLFALPAVAMPAYTAWVGAVVRRYSRTAAEGNALAMPGLARGVRRFSFTPESGTNWCPAGDAPGITSMFQATLAAIHAADPTAQVLLPFTTEGVYLTAFADGYLTRSTIVFQGQTLTRADVAVQFASNIAFTKALVAGTTPDAYDLHLYGDADSIPGRKAWLDAYLISLGRTPVPVVACEGGEPYSKFGETFPTGPSTCPSSPYVEDANRLAFQSGALLRHVALAASSGFGMITMNLGPEYAAFSAAFGDLDLVDACGTARPAFWTYQSAIGLLGGYATASEVPSPPASVRLVRFTFPSPRTDVTIAWDAAAVGTAASPHNLSSVLPFATATVTHAVTVAGVTTPSVTTEASAAVVFGAVPVLLRAAP